MRIFRLRIKTSYLPRLAIKLGLTYKVDISPQERIKVDSDNVTKEFKDSVGL